MDVFVVVWVIEALLKTFGSCPEGGGRSLLEKLLF
jgi:hypothetical protein